LGAREALSEAALSAWTPLAAAVTAGEVEGSLLPAMLRMAKRSPEGVVRSTASFLGGLKLDLSASAAGLATEMVPMLRHPKENVRRASVHLHTPFQECLRISRLSRASL